MKKPLIGFIGQGWIGKNYADDFERRGYQVIRYSLEESYRDNKERIRTCDIVFIAVPTPTTPRGFNDSIVRATLPLVGKNKIAVIKSTLSLGLTRDLQKEFSHCTVLHSPEFLSENTAAHDAAYPERNIIGLPQKTAAHTKAAKKVMSVLPPAPFNLICSSAEAELIKYAHNIHGYIQVVFSNMMYDTARGAKADWETLVKAIKADPFMSHRYLKPVDKKGRGAGGHCFVKDFEAFIGIYKTFVDDDEGTKALVALRDKNLELLKQSKKDLDIVREVYGDV